MFTPQAGATVTIKAGDTVGYAIVTLTDDAVIELDEQFRVQLTNATHATLDPTYSVAVGKILNDDKQEVSITTMVATATEGGGNGKYQFDRNWSAGTLQVNYSYKSAGSICVSSWRTATISKSFHSPITGSLPLAAR